MIGLVLYVAFFIAIFVWMIRKKEEGRKDLWMMTLAFLPTCMIGMIYNNAVQMESCYLTAFTCAIPFVLMKRQSENDTKNKNVSKKKRRKYESKYFVNAKGR